MSRPRSMLYLRNIFFIFIFIFIMINRMNTVTLVFFAYFLEYVLLFLDGNVNEECE